MELLILGMAIFMAVHLIPLFLIAVGLILYVVIVKLHPYLFGVPAIP